MNGRLHFEAPIVITLPRVMEGEAEALMEICKEPCAPIVHIRKPESSERDVACLLDRLKASGCDMSRLTIHYNEPLARKYGLGGVHLRGEELEKGAGAGLRRSLSTHSWKEVQQYAGRVDYLFISPLFDSISKPGYRSGLDPEETFSRLAHHAGRVVALGGISSDTMMQVERLGFDGAAVLGAVWSVDEGRIDVEKSLKNYRVLCRKWRAAGGVLQFISDGNLAVAEQFLKGGGRWIQLRMKEAPEAEVLKRGEAMRVLCRRYGAVFIMNDNPEWAKAVGADGVHLGQKDRLPEEARQILGDGAIIGSTVNTFNQIAARCHGKTDYFGLGPFRFTTTKKNLSAILGVEGYRNIAAQMRAEKIDLPVVAIGGIELEDVPQILRSGMPGVALSGAIARSVDPKWATASFLRVLETERTYGPKVSDNL